jgi:hypothetical protein
MKKFLYFPIKNGQWLIDSRGKVRLYKSFSSAVRNCKDREYDHIQVFVLDDVLSRKECERGVNNAQ